MLIKLIFPQFIMLNFPIQTQKLSSPPLLYLCLCSALLSSLPLTSSLFIFPSLYSLHHFFFYLTCMPTFHSLLSSLPFHHCHLLLPSTPFYPWLSFFLSSSHLYIACSHLPSPLSLTSFLPCPLLHFGLSSFLTVLYPFPSCVYPFLSCFYPSFPLHLTSCLPSSSLLLLFPS